MAHLNPRLEDLNPALWTRRRLELAHDTDVYSGVLLRNRRAGGSDAVSDTHLLWAELDTPDALGRLDAFPLAPAW